MADVYTSPPNPGASRFCSDMEWAAPQISVTILRWPSFRAACEETLIISCRRITPSLMILWLPVVSTKEQKKACGLILSVCRRHSKPYHPQVYFKSDHVADR
jgi:hypothetical protein